jgi:hypothetical protein
MVLIDDVSRVTMDGVAVGGTGTGTGTGTSTVDLWFRSTVDTTIVVWIHLFSTLLYFSSVQFRYDIYIRYRIVQ